MAETTSVTSGADAHSAARLVKAPKRTFLEDGDKSSDDLSVIDETDASAWAIPYTDLTMLLLVFFVILLSQAKPSATAATGPEMAAEWLAENERTTLESDGRATDSPLIVDGGSGVLPGREALASQRADGQAEPAVEWLAENTRPAPAGAERAMASPLVFAGGSGAHEGGETLAEQRADVERDLGAEWGRRVGELQAAAASFLEQNDLGDDVGLFTTEAGIELRMSDDILFHSGAATLEARGLELIGRLAPLLRQIEGAIEVSGHTDDLPIQTVRFPSNWELSAARAIAVVRRPRDLDVPEHKMKAVGHGANRPVASNDDPAARSKNRRVTIDITPRFPRI